MMLEGIAALVDALELLGLAGPVAGEMERRGTLKPDALRRELRAAVDEALDALGVGAGSAPAAGSAWLTVQAAAARVGLTPATIREWCTAGRLKASKAGRTWRIKPEDLDRALERAGDGDEEVDVGAEADRIINLDAHRR